ncbi:MAG: DUF4240 domain-containing protein [Mucilaginibacter sp.]
MKVFIGLLFPLMFLAFGCSGPGRQHTATVIAEYKMGDNMDEHEFWKIVDYAFSTSDGNMKRQAQVITQKLLQYKPKQIVDFEIMLSKKIIEANDFKIIAADKIIDGSVSDDTFLYFRCWLIGLGQNTFEQTIKNPDYLAEVIDKGVVPDFEDLLYVSTTAYRNKTGVKKEDDTFPRNVAFTKGLNYDFGGPKTTGKDCMESELPGLYPKLWNKFK